MKQEDMEPVISHAEIDMEKACPECGDMGVTGNGVCLSCLTKIVRLEPMKSVGGMEAQIDVLETLQRNKAKLTAAIGHNSQADGGISGQRLRSFINRIEKLEEDKASVGEDLKEVYAEAKGTGYDAKVIRQIIRLRKVEVEKRRENAELLDLYMSAIGMED